MYDEIKNWFLRESLVFAFELDDITYDDFLECIKDIVFEELQKNEGKRKETFSIKKHLNNPVYENLNEDKPS